MFTDFNIQTYDKYTNASLKDFVEKHCVGKEYDSCKNSPCLYASSSGCQHPLYPKQKHIVDINH
jgi:hypothetical protein